MSKRDHKHNIKKIKILKLLIGELYRRVSFTDPDINALVTGMAIAVEMDVDHVECDDCDNKINQAFDVLDKWQAGDIAAAERKTKEALH